MVVDLGFATSDSRDRHMGKLGLVESSKFPISTAGNSNCYRSASSHSARNGDAANRTKARSSKIDSLVNSLEFVGALVRVARPQRGI